MLPEGLAADGLAMLQAVLADFRTWGCENNYHTGSPIERGFVTRRPSDGYRSSAPLRGIGKPMQTMYRGLDYRT